ncbi:MAG TPA: metallophosphoesterase [Gemmatimonadales bacterium]|nr:metallophosphoesterase [Gemmatimonadales bacterium]
MPSVGTILTFFMTWTLVWWIPLRFLLTGHVPGDDWTLVAFLLLALAPLAPLLRALIGRRYPSAMIRVLIFRPFWYLLLMMPLVSLAGIVGAAAGWPFGAAGAVGRWTTTATAIVLLTLGIVGYFGSRRLRIKPLDLAFPGLPDGFDGFRIVQLSDLHVGPQTSRRFLARVAHAVEQLDGDLIAITGDQVDDFHEDVALFVNAFGHLRAPLGVFAIAGNHDVYAGWELVRYGMESAGMRVLVNTAVPLTRNGSTIWLAGTGDPAASGAGPLPIQGPAPDIGATLSRVPDRAFIIALAHNPALWPLLVERDVQLTLSGHTHYGQFAIPRLGWSIASPFLRLAMGLHRESASTLYINPGTNHWGLPFRIGTPPEITVITLLRCA